MAADHITYFNRSTGKLEQEDIYGEAPLRFAYQNPAGRAMLELLVKRGMFSRWYGWRMDKPASRARVGPFIAKYGLDAAEFADAPESYGSFNEILETTLLFPLFFFKTLKTRVTQFMATIFAEKDPWKPIRENHADIEHFHRGCHEKLDGLRILQYLKAENALQCGSDEERFFEWFLRFCGQAELRKLKINPEKFSFKSAQTEQLEAIRTFLFVKEMEARFNSELE